MARVLAVSSHVARGHVGLHATVCALQHFGHEVWPVPTVLLASRPGLGQLARFEVPPAQVTSMLSALQADACWPSLDAVFTGYFPSAASVEAAAFAIGELRAANPRAAVLVDPILGDAGRLYVDADTAAAIRDRLLPLATIATPNHFELTWLTGAEALAGSGLVDAVRKLGPPAVIVTSAAVTENHVTTVAVHNGTIIRRDALKYPAIPNGAGDLFAGLFLGSLLTGLNSESALDRSLASLHHVLGASAGKDVLQLSALNDGASAQS
jgi:pyridoxine kinase